MDAVDDRSGHGRSAGLDPVRALETEICSIARVVWSIAPHRVLAERSIVVTVTGPESLAHQFPDEFLCQLISHLRRPSASRR